MTSTVTSVLLKILKKHGIRHIFGLPAAQIGLLMDGAGKDPYFNYITTRHEEAAGHMAHAIGKMTDSMAVCFATVGPGATNLVPGVAAAWADNIPMLVITPDNQHDSIEPGKDLLQNANQRDLYSAITKWNATIHTPERAGELIERAIHIARSGRPGPVHLNIPCDIGTAPCDHDVDSIPPIARPRPVPNRDDLNAVADLLANAKRPALLAGGGVVRADGVEEFRELVNLTGFPATTTAHARGTVPFDCATHVGSSGVLGGWGVAETLSESDVLLAVGCKFSSFLPLNKPPLYPLKPGQKIIQVDIDGEVLGRNVPLAMGLVGDAREFLRLLNQELDGRTLNADQDWIGAKVDRYKAYRQELDAIADARVTEGTNMLNEAAVLRTIANIIPPDAILATDGGQVMEWCQSFLEPRDPHHFLFVPGMGHLGFGLPMAIAAKSAEPDHTVVCVTGDGAMGMTCQELETAARYGLNVITIVCNDSHWGMYRPFGELLDNPNFGTRLSHVDFAKIAEGYGCVGEKVESLEELPRAFERAQKSDRPAVIDIQVDFTRHPVDDFWPVVVLRGMDLTPVEV
ncbi:MAG: thiamine pyrophosphate-binding protein [Alphaproteobacteria bacterium]|nr:MAG: thiamine pyrophosphate-binding protein [Alphaproteobacteria bacterium]